MNRFKRLALVVAVAALSISAARGQQAGQAQTLLEAARQKETLDGDLQSAIRQYQAIVDAYRNTDRPAAATALIRMAECHQKLGDGNERGVYEQLIADFADQKDPTAVARTRLASLQVSTSSAAAVARKVWSPEFVAGCVTDPGKSSTDGRYLSRTDCNTGDLALHDLSTGADRRLTAAAGDWREYGYASVLSADGRQVAYVWYVDKEKVVELRVASITVTGPIQPRVVLRAGQEEGAYLIAWMPDGKQLVVVRAFSDRTSQIGLVTIQDGSFRSIKSLEWRRPNLLSLSPDGRYVAYDVPAVENGAPRDIWVLATDGSRETVAVSNPADDAFPLWSPDGSRLVFMSNRTGSNALWTVPIAEGRTSGPPALAKADVGPVRPLGVARNGTLFYFLRTGGHPRNLFAADLDGMRLASPPLPLTERLINANTGPSWSRDGEWLAYYSLRDPSTGTLVVRSAKTGEERTISLPPRVVTRFGAGPKWFPDNRSVLVETADAQGAGAGFYRLSLDTGNTERVAHLAREVTSYDLSPDGRTIFYALTTPNLVQKLVRVEIDGQRETELRSVPFGEDGWHVVALAVSPDGQQLATTLIGGAVEVRSAAGGPARSVFRPTSHELGTGALLQALSWTPDQLYLIWVRGDRTLWKVPSTGGPAEKVGIPMQFVKNLALRPDGKQMVFDATDQEPTEEVWALENFLPAQKASH